MPARMPAGSCACGEHACATARSMPPSSMGYSGPGFNGGKYPPFRILEGVRHTRETIRAMSSFNGKIGDFMVIARYQFADNHLVWNAVLYQAGNPVLSVAGNVAHDPKVSPVDLVEAAIAEVIETRFPKHKRDRLRSVSQHA